MEQEFKCKKVKIVKLVCWTCVLDLCAGPVRWTYRVRRMSKKYTDQLHKIVHARTLCAEAQGPAHETLIFSEKEEKVLRKLF